MTRNNQLPFWKAATKLTVPFRCFNRDEERKSHNECGTKWVRWCFFPFCLGVAFQNSVLIVCLLSWYLGKRNSTFVYFCSSAFGCLLAMSKERFHKTLYYFSSTQSESPANHVASPTAKSPSKLTDRLSMSPSPAKPFSLPPIDFSRPPLPISANTTVLSFKSVRRPSLSFYFFRSLLQLYN